MERWLLQLLVAGSLSMAILTVQEPPTRQQQRPGTHGQTAPGKQPAQASSLRGCLKQLGGNWVLAADTGQTVTLVGDSSMLRPHDGRQIEVHGRLAGDGSFHVISVTRISDACTSRRALLFQLSQGGR
jgi:uncharacterized protein DUF5818